MTECTFDLNKYELTCKGHASGEGDDKSICTALTTLVLTLAFDIDEIADLCSEKEIKIEPGYYHIKVTPAEGAEEQIAFLFTAFVNGIYMLSEDEKLKEHITLTVTAEE